MFVWPHRAYNQNVDDPFDATDVGKYHVRFVPLSNPCCTGATELNSDFGGIIGLLKDQQTQELIEAATAAANSSNVAQWAEQQAFHGVGWLDNFHLSQGFYKLCIAMNNAAPFSDSDYTAYTRGAGFEPEAKRRQIGSLGSDR